jgi:hypothetical protein
MARGFIETDFQDVVVYVQPFLLFEREERANETIKGKIQSLFQRGAKAELKLKTE